MKTSKISSNDTSHERRVAGKRDVLSLADLSPSEIYEIIRLAREFKHDLISGHMPQPLRGMNLGMIFQKPSTRTRVSFEVGMNQLGGNAISLNSSDIQLARGESVEDTAKTLSLYVNCIMARVYAHGDVEALAKYASVPVINGLSDHFHPCQILADLMTIQECFGRLKGIRVAWLGDGDNVCNDMLIGCAKSGADVSIASPRSYAPLNLAIEIARDAAEASGSAIDITDDPMLAAKDADVIVTDTFVSIGKEEEVAARQRAFIPKYQVDSELMAIAKKDAIFLHCLPAKRGQEVTTDVIDGPQSKVWQEAENRLHVQKALLCFLLDPKINPKFS